MSHLSDIFEVQRSPHSPFTMSHMVLYGKPEMFLEKPSTVCDSMIITQLSVKSFQAGFQSVVHKSKGSSVFLFVIQP